MIKARGKQRTDSTWVLAAVRDVNRLELVGETLRAALNELATEFPEWLQSVVPAVWYVRYGRRVEEGRLPRSKAKREALAHTIGEDGFMLLDFLAAPGAPARAGALAQVQILRRVWERHYVRQKGKVRFLAQRELSSVSEAVATPYDDDARYRQRAGKKWIGYMVHVSETCDDDEPYLLTNILTTTASVHEAKCTDQIHQALMDKGLPPGQHLVDSAYIDAELLVSSEQEQSIVLEGPTRPNRSWHTKMEGAYDLDQFMVDWENKQVKCPQGKSSVAWRELIMENKGNPYPYIQVRFHSKECGVCDARHLCTRGKQRRLKLLPQQQYEALRQARQRHSSEEGKHLAAKREGVEGTISQGVRAFGLRRARYRGLAKTRLQHLATAAAINLDRIVAWLNGTPRGGTSISRFSALAPSI